MDQELDINVTFRGYFSLFFRLYITLLLGVKKTAEKVRKNDS